VLGFSERQHKLLKIAFTFTHPIAQILYKNQNKRRPMKPAFGNTHTYFELQWGKKVLLGGETPKFFTFNLI
jgi:hypothetical protein